MFYKKPIIGIVPTISSHEVDPYQDRTNFVRMYSEKIKESGGIPIGILEDPSLYTGICDGYVWPGGNQILFDYYPILLDAIKNQKPFLGICLGVQVLATFLNLLEDQGNNKAKSLKETYNLYKENKPYLKKLEDENCHFHIVTKENNSILSARHKIKIEKNSLLYEIFKKEEMNVVSLHSMGISRVSKDTIISAKAMDEVLEAIEYRENGCLLLGVQFHPEIEKENFLFDWLISSTRKYLTLVNRENPIKYSKNFKIIEYHSKYPNCTFDSNLERKTCEVWVNFQKFLKENGYDAEIESAYRTKEMQETIYNAILEKEGIEYASKYVAQPRFSEHELGLSIDVCLKMNEEWLSGFDERLTEFYSFLEKYCSDFGFILRYPKGKEEITKYNYEPWHIRYVHSKKIAHEIMDNNLTLEEYLNKK